MFGFQDKLSTADSLQTKPQYTRNYVTRVQALCHMMSYGTINLIVNYIVINKLEMTICFILKPSTLGCIC